MLKVIAFLLAGIVVITVAWLLAGIPGHVAASIGTFTFETSPAIAILVLAVIVIVVLIVMLVVRGVIALPRSGASWRRRRRQALGEKAVTRALVALSADEKEPARKQARRARALLGDTPRTLLLSAEASRLAGREDEAEAAFHALAKQHDSRFLGLRGLLRQALDRRDWTQAGTIASQAEASHPGTVWLRQQRAELALQNDNWIEAVELIGSDPRQPVYCVAAADAETDPKRSLAFAKQAWQQDHAFVPAALAYASRLRAIGYEMRAQSCIMEAWISKPHPDLAAFALAPQTELLGRTLVAQRLAVRRPSHPESRYLTARAAFDAGMIREARHQLEIAQTEGTSQRRFFLLLAQIEEQERGGTEAGRLAQREALRRASAAEPDPRWQCTNCHADQPAWYSRCPVCRNVGTIQWLSGHSLSRLPVIAA